MRTLKKALALVVVLAMALGTVATAVQYQDVADDYDYAQAITLLSGLGVLQGDESGFRPEATITRAESCAVIYRMMSGNTYANNYAGATDFSDVTANNWASGYINYCTAFGVIVGYPDGTFKPDAPVTFGEFVTMLVRALGCDKEDDGDSLNLTFPAGYMGVADQQGVLDSTMTLGADDAAFRGLVAQLAYNAIFEAEYMRAGYVSGKDEYYYETIAEKVFNMYEDTGIVQAYGAYDFSTKGTGDEEVCISGEIYDCASLDVETFLYREVKFWTDGDEVFAVTISDDNSEVTANAEDVSWDDTDIEVAGDSYGNTVALGAVNYDPTLTATICNFTAADPQWDDMFEKNVATTYTLIDNDDDGDFEAVIMKAYALADIDLIDEDTMYYSSVTTDSGADISGFDLTDTDLEADLGDVTFSNYEPEEGDTVMYIYYPLANGGEAADENGDFEMYALDDITGKYTSYSSTTSAYTIGGSKYYELEGDNTMTYSVNTEVEAAQLPIYGYIYDIAEPDDADSATKDIYLVTKMGSDASGRYGTETTYYLTAWNTDGEEVEFEVDADAVVNGSAGFDAATDTSTTLGLVLTDANAAAFDVEVGADSGLEIYLAYLGFDDGVVDEISPVATEFSAETAYDEEFVKYSTSSDLLYLDNGMATVKTLIESDSVSYFWNDGDEEATVYYGTFPTDIENTCLVRYYENDSYSPAVAALFDGEPTSSDTTDTDTYYGILIDATVYGNPDDDDESYIEYTIAADGKIATYATEMGDIDLIDDLYEATDDLFIDGNNDAFDDVVMTFDVNYDGEIVLQNYVDTLGTDGADSAADYLATFGYAVDSGYVDSGKIVTIGSGLIDVGSEYEIASDVNVYVTKGDGTWDETYIGSLTSVKADTSADGGYTRNAVVILSEDLSDPDTAPEDVEVVEIFYFQGVVPTPAS